MDAHSHTQPPPPRGEVISGPLRTDDEILARVSELIGPEDRQRQSLWLFFFDREMRQMPVVVPVDDVPDRPDPRLAGNTCWIITEVLADTEPGGSAVITLTRPGPAEFGDVERHWYHVLTDGGRQHDTPLRMLCLATPDGVRELAPPSG